MARLFALPSLVLLGIKEVFLLQLIAGLQLSPLCKYTGLLLNAPSLPGHPKSQWLLGIFQQQEGVGIARSCDKTERPSKGLYRHVRGGS